MLNPNSKSYSLHPDAQKIYDHYIKNDPQLRKIYDGLTWLISNKYQYGKCIHPNYYLIKSSENIPKWHSETMNLESMPTISILYYVEKDIVIEAINIKEKL